MSFIIAKNSVYCFFSQIQFTMYYKRIIYNSIRKHLDKKEHTIIVGARQVGKTTLLKKLYKEIAGKKQAYYLTFENPEILSAINQHPENIFRYARKPESEQPENRVFIFIDEVQYAANPSNLLKYLFDTCENRLKIVATGSSAFYIDRKFTDSLAGRKKIFHLKGLNFEEFLTFRNAGNLISELVEMRKTDAYRSVFYHELRYYFEEYLIFGGYPAVVLEKEIDEKKYRLNELRNSYMKKDILEANIQYDLKFFQLVALLSDSVGSLVNNNELANTLGINNKTVESYLHLLQKSYHIALIPPFYTNLRKEITKMPKVYFRDTGLRNSFINRFDALNNRNDKGQLIENYVFIRLAELYNDEYIRFWHLSGGQEVDFVINQAVMSGKAYEVKYSSKTINRTKYQKFTDNYKPFPLQFICYEHTENTDAVDILKL